MNEEMLNQLALKWGVSVEKVKELFEALQQIEVRNVKMKDVNNWINRPIISLENFIKQNQTKQDSIKKQPLLELITKEYGEVFEPNEIKLMVNEIIDNPLFKIKSIKEFLENDNIFNVYKYIRNKNKKKNVIKEESRKERAERLKQTGTTLSGKSRKIGEVSDGDKEYEVWSVDSYEDAKELSVYGNTLNTWCISQKNFPYDKDSRANHQGLMQWESFVDGKNDEEASWFLCLFAKDIKPYPFTRAKDKICLQIIKDSGKVIVWDNNNDQDTSETQPYIKDIKNMEFYKQQVEKYR